MEQNVYGIIFLAEYGINAPTERELLIGARVRRHTYNVDHGTETGNHLRRSSGARAHDDRLRVDVACQKACRMGERVRKSADQIFALVHRLNELRSVFRLLRDARHSRNRLHGICARRRFARKHDRAGTVVHGVGNVGNFRTRGTGVFDHGFKHFRCGNAALACDTAGIDDRFLNIGQFFVGDFHAHIAAPDHDSVGNVEDLVQVIHARAVLDFCDEIDVGRAVLFQEVPDV